MYVKDTIVAPATPPGAGAVAIVRLSGPRAIEIMRAMWHPASPGELRPRSLRLGEIRDPETLAAIDRVLAVAMPAPKSLTGEDVVEFQCHGGTYIVRRVLTIAIALGARVAERGEFSCRAYLNGRMDLTEAEAIADLVAADSESALGLALAQLGGALRERIEGLRRQVIGVRAHLEAEIDFGDEDIRLPARSELAAEIERLRTDIAILHDSFARGRIMREGVRAAIVGKPNAGKSSILNLLLGAERAIVTPIPGTTRDVIEDSIRLGPYTLVLQDTAGVRQGRDLVEELGIERTLKYAADAELLIAVFDCSEPLDAEDRRVIELLANRAGIAILNKIDLPLMLSRRCLSEQGVAMPILELSAIAAESAAPLRDELLRALEALAGERRSDDVAISRERHRDALAQALEALTTARSSVLDDLPAEIVAVDVMAAADALGSITGEVATEDVLDAVFREFCIGK